MNEPGVAAEISNGDGGGSSGAFAACFGTLLSKAICRPQRYNSQSSSRAASSSDSGGEPEKLPQSRMRDAGVTSNYNEADSEGFMACAFPIAAPQAVRPSCML